MGLNNGTVFVNITNAANPVVVGFLRSHNNRNSSWRDIKTYNNYAFIVSEAVGHGMQVFDLKRLRNVSSYTNFNEDAHLDTFNDAHNIIINNKTPAIVPGKTLPLPPNKLVPPITTAATA